MGLIGSIAGGLTSAVGGALAAKARNKGYNDYINMFQDRMQQVKDHRDNLYYQDPTQSAENQVAVTNAQKVLDNATATAKNTNIVSGGSDEAVALSKQAAQEQVGNIMQQAAVQGAQTKENVWNTAIILAFNTSGTLLSFIRSIYFWVSCPSSRWAFSPTTAYSPIPTFSKASRRPS